MQVTALYGNNNDDLDLFNNGLYAVPTGVKSYLFEVTRSIRNMFTSSTLELSDSALTKCLIMMILGTRN